MYVSVDINGSPSRYLLLENILFENNVFQEMTGPAIEAASFKNLVISNNTFINREKAPIAVKMRGSIHAELGRGLWVEGNEWTTQKGLASPSLFYDADTTQNNRLPGQSSEKLTPMLKDYVKSVTASPNRDSK